jgi:predicted GNAT family acetyltransferase
MQVTRFPDPRSFLARAEPFLLRAEAENNLMLGITGTPRYFGADAYLATVDRGGAVVACALRTPPFKAVITAGEPSAIDSLVIDLAERYPDLAQVHGPEPAVSHFAGLWSKRTGVPSIQGTRLRLFEIHEAPRAAPRVGGALRLATEQDLATITAWTTAFIAEALPGDPLNPETHAAEAIAMRTLSVWEDGGLVSMAGWAGKTPRGVRVNFVYSPPECRGRGYATACVSALTQQLLDEGRAFCCLYADRSNPTSTGIYQKIGYRAIGDSSDYVLNSRKAATVR